MRSFFTYFALAVLFVLGVKLVNVQQRYVKPVAPVIKTDDGKLADEMISRR
ncbi:hypothetical protein ACO2Q8_23650 [Larkinella sp. VNQ87]|uniref:hypothetical protein n=1 Tax=Larkinella sp. VNQ87 TaxID=3400921 RepID=UPI003C0321B2